MNQEEILIRIETLSGMYAMPVDRMLVILEKALKHKQSRKEAARAYYLENKEKLDKYHADYRAKNPDYRKRAADRAKRHR